MQHASVSWCEVLYRSQVLFALISIIMVCMNVWMYECMELFMFSQYFEQLLQVHAKWL